MNPLTDRESLELLHQFVERTVTQLERALVTALKESGDILAAIEPGAPVADIEGKLAEANRLMAEAERVLHALQAKRLAEPVRPEETRH